MTEISGLIDLTAWPRGSRLIVRRERPHPGAQLSFTDIAGHRFQCVLTDQTGDELASIEARHRAHAHVEDRIRCARDTGLRNLPFSDFAANACWLELVLCAQELICFTQRLLLDGELAACEPKRLRYRLLHVAGRDQPPRPKDPAAPPQAPGHGRPRCSRPSHGYEHSPRPAEPRRSHQHSTPRLAGSARNIRLPNNPVAVPKQPHDLAATRGMTPPAPRASPPTARIQRHRARDR